ncbi:hypothetical protein [Halostagnicola sp. A56]|nr:hypothetical protein [Halostagnicola sp. A56]
MAAAAVDHGQVVTVEMVVFPLAAAVAAVVALPATGVVVMVATVPEVK